MGKTPSSALFFVLSVNLISTSLKFPFTNQILIRSCRGVRPCKFLVVFIFATSFSLRRSFVAAALVLASVVLTCSQPANAIPAFARKYGLRCSACHESWPMLNYFGQKFKDNGYQLMNDRDAPIWQNPGYWPVTFRITPIWHRVSTGKVELTPMRRWGRLRRGCGGPAHYEFRLRSERPRLPHRRNSGEEHLVLCASVLRCDGLRSTLRQSMARLDNMLGSSWLNIQAGQVRTGQPAF